MIKHFFLFVFLLVSFNLLSQTERRPITGGENLTVADSIQFVYPERQVIDTFKVIAIVDVILSKEELIKRENISKTPLTYSYLFIVVKSWVFPGAKKTPFETTIYTTKWSIIDPTKYNILNLTEVK